MSNKKSSTSFLVQGSILAMASIISRIIGLVYRIPLTAIIGNKGNDYYGCAFEIYNILLIISSYSLPLAVSKLVSADMSLGRKKNVYRILKCALIFGLVSGTIAALILFFGAEFITGTIMKTPYSIFCSEGACANTDRSCGARRYARIFSGTRNDDAKRSLTDLRTDRKCDRECVGSLCALQLRNQSGSGAWKYRKLCGSLRRCRRNAWYGNRSCGWAFVCILCAARVFKCV